MTSLLTQGSSSTDNNDKSIGFLEVSILSAYDLPAREPPAGIQILVAGQAVTTGPPVQRHKDRNSFKFSPPTTNGNGTATNEAKMIRPLAQLYPATATLRVVYEASTDRPPLAADYRLDQLRVHETQWLVLNLESGSGSSANVDNEEEDAFRVAPTLRVKLTLHGPYRTEIVTALQLATAWFRLIDRLEESGAVVIKALPDPKWFLVPLAPLLGLAVVSTPVVAGVLVVALPMVLPFLVILAVGSAVVTASALFLYASTKTGRSEWLHPLLQPAVATCLSTPTGQQLVYQTGGRPSPVHLCRMILPQESLWGKLLVSLWIDLIGSSSYLLPVVGEGFDLAWAPIQTILIMAMYDEVMPNLKYVSFVEEILPFTDIVPSATIGWLTEFGVPWVQDRLGWKLEDVAAAVGGGSRAVATTPAGNNRTPFSTPR